MYLYIYLSLSLSSAAKRLLFYMCTRLKRLANKARDAGNDLAKLKEQEAWLRERVYKQEAANLSRNPFICRKTRSKQRRFSSGSTTCIRSWFLGSPKLYNPL